MSRHGAALALLTGLLLSSCSTGGPASGSSSTQPRTEAPSSAAGTNPSPTAMTPSTPVPSTVAPSIASPSTASGSTAAPPVPAAPASAACYRLTFAQLPAGSNDDRPVSCRSPHTAQTIWVGRFTLVSEGKAVALDSEAVQLRLAATCGREEARFLGGSVGTRRLSRFTVVWFQPTSQQVDEGARWFRCDVVAFAGPKSLLGLPPTRRLRSVLDDRRALARYGLCGTAAPGSGAFTRVACARRHSWRAVSTVALGTSSTYPGRAAVRRAGAGVCRTRARHAQSYSPTLRYGWEWPARDQWLNGQHYGYCWAPD